MQSNAPGSVLLLKSALKAAALGGMKLDIRRIKIVEETFRELGHPGVPSVAAVLIGEYLVVRGKGGGEE